MQKRTSYEFEGKTGYTYVTKAYSSNDAKFEIHFRVNENDVDTIHFGIGKNDARSVYRSLGRTLVEIDREFGLDAIKSGYDEFRDEFESAECEE